MLTSIQQPGTSAHYKLRQSHLLGAALCIYALLVLFLSIRQKGYIDADFVGYSTIARRILLHEGRRISGYWSPLFSWCMVPLLYVGFSDMAAGRIVLVVAGVLYLIAIYGVVSRFRRHDAHCDLLITAGVLTCAVFQASAWATSLLNPDLLADSFLYLCFFVLLDPAITNKPGRAFLAGVIAGIAYLGKAFMLPFLLVLLPITLLMRRRSQIPAAGETHKPFRNILISLLFFLIGLGLVAGPWMCVLTSHYHAFTFSTSGSSNHANVGPGNVGHDPLWHPGLVAGFIVDPGMTGDWSPFQDASHFIHQCKVFLHNALNVCGAMPLWLVLAGIGMTLRFMHSRPREERLSNIDPGIWWCLLAAFIYCGGYCLIDVLPRYIAPVVSPLLCLAALLLIRDASSRDAGTTNFVARWVTTRSVPVFVMLILPFTLQDVYRIARIAWQHPQSAPLAPNVEIADQMANAHLNHELTAASEFHAGLFVAYASDNISNYLGAPKPNAPTNMVDQLNTSGAKVYMRWVRNDPSASAPNSPESFIPPAPWIKSFVITPTSIAPIKIEVYVLPNP